MKNIRNDVKMEFVTSNLPAWERKGEVKARRHSHLVTKVMNSITLGVVRPKADPIS